MHQASRSLMVEGASPMHGVPVVLHDDVAGSPLVCVDELWLCREFDQFADELLAVVFSHAFEATNEIE
jgi:hypothetical protein